MTPITFRHTIHEAVGIYALSSILLFCLRLTVFYDLLSTAFAQHKLEGWIAIEGVSVAFHRLLLWRVSLFIFYDLKLAWR